MSKYQWWPTSKENRLLQALIHQNDLAKAKNLFRLGADPNAVNGDDSLFSKAIDYVEGNILIDTIKLFLAGADINLNPNEGGVCLLYSAFWRNDIKVIDYLLRNGVKPNYASRDDILEETLLEYAEDDLYFEEVLQGVSEENIKRIRFLKDFIALMKKYGAR